MIEILELIHIQKENPIVNRTAFIAKFIKLKNTLIKNTNIINKEISRQYQTRRM